MRLTTATVVLSAAMAGLSASSAAAASPEACALIPPAAIAKAFGLTHTQEYYSHSTQPGNGSGSVGSLCRVMAWSGSQPTNRKQSQAKFANGTAASLVINTRAEDPGSPAAENWRNSDFDHELNAALGGATIALLKTLHGTHFATPLFGAEHALGDQAAKGGSREAVGIWWDQDQFSFMVLDVVEAKQLPYVKQLKKIAKTAVPAFGL
jgi:hypothetical protein